MGIDYRKTKLGFANPLLPNGDDISHDPFELLDPIASQRDIKAKEEVFTRRNVYKGTREYVGIVIEEPTDLLPAGGVFEAISNGIANIFQLAVGKDEVYKKMRIHCKELHASLPNPCDFAAISTGQGDAANLARAEAIIKQHGQIIAKINTANGELPVFGDIVKFKFAKGPDGGKQQFAELIEILSSNNMESLANSCEQSAINKFAAGLVQRLGTVISSP